MSYIAAPGSEGEIQRIYISYFLDNLQKTDVYRVEFKSGKDMLLNLVNPYALKFDCDRLAVQKAQSLFKKKNPRGFVCTIM
jgi:hypothetical protein